MEKERKEFLLQQVASLMEDEDLCLRVFRAEDAGQLCGILEENGIGATPEEVTELALDGLETARTMAAGDEDELSLDELEAVSGGAWLNKKQKAAIARGVLCLAAGSMIAIGLGVAVGVTAAMPGAGIVIGAKTAKWAVIGCGAVLAAATVLG